MVIGFSLQFDRRVALVSACLAEAHECCKRIEQAAGAGGKRRIDSAVKHVLEDTKFSFTERCNRGKLAHFEGSLAVSLVQEAEGRTAGFADGPITTGELELPQFRKAAPSAGCYQQKFSAPDRPVRTIAGAVPGDTEDWRLETVLGNAGGDVSEVMLNRQHRKAGHLSGASRSVIRMQVPHGKNRVLREVQISEGSLNQSIVHPREVFNPAVRESAAAIILVHNHPTGDPTPSREDLEITRRLREAGDLMGVRVLDHVIIGDGRYTSFADRGMM